MSSRDELLLASDAELERACAMDRYRASGPGGQHRNKTESAIRLRHLALGVTVHADGSRSQAENRATAVTRMREALALQVRQGMVLEGWQPEAALAAFVAGGGRDITRRSRQSGAVLLQFARLLDVVEACGGEVGAAAQALGTSSSALSKLLTYDDDVVRAVNEMRSRRGLRALR